jgi:Na+/H+ antiporter NhaD/arsenite permease-like protein
MYPEHARPPSPGPIGLFLTPVPAALVALGVAAVVLASRRVRTREILELVDWQLLVLFAALFVVVRGFENAGGTRAIHEFLADCGLDLASLPVVGVVTVLLGNAVSNVPAVMLVLPFVPHSPDMGHALALSSTFGGNAVLVASIANLIVVEQAARLGVRIGWREHARVGIPVTIVSLAIALVWLVQLG